MEKEILANRAKLISGHRGVSKQIEEKFLSVVEFSLLPENYGFEETYVTEVFSLGELTEVPGTPSYVMGVINLKGRIVSVLNLKKLFNLKERGLTELNKVMILKYDKMEFGIVADSIVGIRMLPVSTLSPPPITLDSIAIEFVSGIAPDGLILIDAVQLLSGKQIVVNQ